MSSYYSERSRRHSRSRSRDRGRSCSYRQSSGRHNDYYDRGYVTNTGYPHDYRSDRYARSYEPGYDINYSQNRYQDNVHTSTPRYGWPPPPEAATRTDSAQLLTSTTTLPAAHSWYQNGTSILHYVYIKMGIACKADVETEDD